MKKLVFRKILILISIFFVFNFIVLAQREIKYNLEDEEDLLEEVEMIIGDIQIFKADSPTRVSVRNPEIVDIQKIDENEIVISGKSKGITYFVFWDRAGEHRYHIKVLPEDTEYINAQVIKILKNLNLMDVYTKIFKEEGKILLLGKVEKFEDKERLKTALGDLFNRVTDLTEVKAGQLVEITSEVLELDRDSTKKLGIEWPTSVSLAEQTGRWQSLAKMPDALFRISDWTREIFTAKLDFLLREGKARILSRPYLLCESGKEAEMMVGGEVPIFQTTAIVGGATGTTVEYKEFGIKFKISPIVKEDNNIQLNLNVEVSDVGEVDSIGTIQKGVGTETTTTTAKAYPLSKRNISTQLHLKDGEVLVIGGLIKQKTQEDLKKIPWLSDVPILGTFFKHSKVETGGGSPKLQDTELFITLTPRIITAKERLSQKEKEAMKQKEDFINLHKNSTIPTELQEYVLNIQKKINDNIIYPVSLLNTGWEGMVLLLLNIEANGWLRDAQILKSSGYKIFDEEAIKLVKGLSYSPFPPDVDLKELKIKVPIVYRQKN